MEITVHCNNECVNVYVCMYVFVGCPLMGAWNPIQGVFPPHVPKIDSRSTLTRTKIKQLLKMNA